MKTPWTYCGSGVGFGVAVVAVEKGLGARVAELVLTGAGESESAVEKDELGVEAADTAPDAAIENGAASRSGFVEFVCALELPVINNTTPKR